MWLKASFCVCTDMYSLHNLILTELENLVGFIINKYNLNTIYYANDTVLMANSKKIELLEHVVKEN